jgi:hypothetical protein
VRVGRYELASPTPIEPEVAPINPPVYAPHPNTLELTPKSRLSDPLIYHALHHGYPGPDCRCGSGRARVAKRAVGGPGKAGAEIHRLSEQSQLLRSVLLL